MKEHPLSRILALVLTLAMLAGFALPVNATQTDTGFSWKESTGMASLEDGRISDTSVEPDHDPAEIVRVSIILEDKPTVQAGYATRDIARNDRAMAYSARLQAKQDQLAQTISETVLDGQALDVVWNLTLVANLISANVAYGELDEIRALDGVRSVVLERTYEPQTAQKEETVSPQMATSSYMIGSNVAWANGYTGAGSRIAVIDTGTDTDHQSFDGNAFLYSLERNAEEAGMSYEEYVESLNLLDLEEIASVLTRLNAYKQNNALTAEDLFLNEKLAYGYNYIDNNLELTHDHDAQGEHGSHVAGIATANSYVPSSNGYQYAIDYVSMAGVAPDAQLITMKAFGASGGPSDADYFAAIEDAILLNCDSVNLSLGTSSAGEPTDPVFAELLDYLTETDLVVVGSAGNAGSWASHTRGRYPYSDDVVYDTVGAPGSYNNWLTVASVDNGGTIVRGFTVADKLYEYTDGTNANNESLASLDKSTDMSGTDYDYIFITGYGAASDYDGMDIEGKILFCSRGTSSFYEKANTAAYLKAAGLIIYNNTSGNFGMDLTNYGYTMPCASIAQESGAAILAVSEEQTTEAGLTYYTGKIHISSKAAINFGDSDYFTMSSFSSWGVPGDLSLKPEITAPGGKIYSVYGSTPTAGGSNQYETMSGTSMASPQVAGMVAVVAQYLRENELCKTTGVSARHLAISLLMSTAEPLYEEASGGYYSLLNQGAGMGRVDLATSAESYILVDGQEDGKVKVELGDDPARTGVYEFTFSINNLTDNALTYALRADVFRQGILEATHQEGAYLLDGLTAALETTTVFTSTDATIVKTESALDCDLNGDGKTNEADASYLLAYLLGNEETLHTDADLNGDGTVNTYDAHLLLTMLDGESTVAVPANGTVHVSVRIALTDAARDYLETYMPKGTYIEAFIYAQPLADAEGSIGVTHSIPLLAFYGNWSEPAMFDRGTYGESITEAGCLEGYMSSLVDYYTGAYSSNFLTLRRDDGEYYFGGNFYATDKEFLPERIAMNNVNGDKIGSQIYSLIRNATRMKLTISNVETGDVYLEKELGETLSAYYNETYASWYYSQSELKLNWKGTDAEGEPLPEGTTVCVSMVAAPSYYGNYEYNENDALVNNVDWDALGEGAYLNTYITIDNTAPTASSITLDALDGKTLTVSAQDNEYIAAVKLMSASGSTTLLSVSPNQTEAGVPVDVELDLTGISGDNFKIAVYDYAHNVSFYDITLGLPEAYRPYFTVCAYTKYQWVGLEEDGLAYTEIASTSGNVIRSAEYVDGYVFEINDNQELLVAKNDTLYDFSVIAELDPSGELAITNALELRYNKADGQMYLLFYSENNSQAAPYLATMDLFTGELTLIAELPMDVNNMAIDGEGNFYSVGYQNPTLYTYTVESITADEPHYLSAVSTGWWATGNSNSMAWDHNTDTLYWAYPNILFEVNTETGECSQIGGFFLFGMTGLFIAPTTGSTGTFDPTDEVMSVRLSHNEARTLVDNTIRLKATVNPWNITDSSVVWTSADESIATVDAQGRVTGVSDGTVTITATSVLDETKFDTCEVTVISLDKTLDGLVWDENGDIWWSEFSSSALPDYTKLTEQPVEAALASTAMLGDTLYAASANSSGGTFKSSLYTVDPETFEIAEIGASYDGYSDIAPAPHLKGGALAATYGGYFLVVDPSTGNYYSGEGEYFHMWQYNLVGITYAGSQVYQDWGFDTVIDWYFLIDSMGYVYMMGWLEQDGTLYYVESDATDEGIFTITNIEAGSSYMCSLHYDGNFIFYTCYDGDNLCTLYAIDTVGSREVYELGSFAEGVWPVGGLMEPGTLSTESAAMNVEVSNAPRVATVIDSDNALDSKNAGSFIANAGGTLTLTAAEPAAQAAREEISLLSSGSYEHIGNQVLVQVTASDFSTNGRLVVSYDAAALELASVSGKTDAFAYAETETGLSLAYAAKSLLAKEDVIAVLTFDIREDAPEAVTLTLTQTEINNDAADSTEYVEIALGTSCPSANYVDIKADHWFHNAVDFVISEGLMIGMDDTHFSPETNMTRAQLVTVLYRIAGKPATEGMQNPFRDVAATAWYADAVIWAANSGVVNGIDATTFGPDMSATREQIVTILYRFDGETPVSENAIADYRDADRISAYAVDAMNWAVATGLLQGDENSRLNPTAFATRAEIATILMRYCAE